AVAPASLAQAAPKSPPVPAAVRAGHEIAVEICSTCHQVGDPQAFPPMLDQATPSFQEIANRPATTAASLRRYITTTHWDEKTIPMTMPSLMLMSDQADQVTRYIMSLRQPAKPTPP
ncbi:MAG: c-type cytochrome, partial [Phenylobacterium sp.]